MMEWLESNQDQVANDLPIDSEPEAIKLQIVRHKEFQRKLGAKQPALDAVNRMGRHIKDRCPRSDVPVIQEMLGQLKSVWNSVCSKSVDRWVGHKYIYIYSV